MTTPTDDVTVRPAESVADYFACQRAQRLAWGINEDGYVIPVATMAGAAHHGGLVLGAFRPDGEAVGMSFAFLGKADGRLCLYSQLTGVVPGYQDKGIGYRIKTCQRDFARAEGVPCVAWAFDPLQAGNARFNLEKLGATCGRYVVDMYGPRTDALNLGAPTDRLIAVWETDPPPPRPAPPEGLPRVVTAGPSGPEHLGLPGYAEAVLLEVPADVNRLRAESPEIARRWGAAVRAGFLEAFRAGFVAVGFQRGDGRAAYVLERKG